MGDLRERDIGWRIDYIYVSKKLSPNILDACTKREVEGSDHGPIGLELAMDMKEGLSPTYHKETLF